VQGTPGGKSNGEWVGNSGAILADAVEAEPRVRAAARLRGGVTLERAARLGQTLTAALVCGRLLGTKYEHGQAMARECLVKCGVLPREDEEEEDDGDEEEHTTRREHASVATKNLVDRSFADDEDALRALRVRVVDAGAQAAREIESLLTSPSKPHDGPFLGGKSPDAADAYLVAALWVAHNLLTSGVARCFAAERGDGATCSFAALGAPSALAYLRAWSARPSWRAVMRAEDTVSSAASLRPLVDGLVAAAPDSCDPRDMLKCMDRARAGDAYYARAVARFGATLPPVPPAAERPLRVPGHVTTWRPEAIEEARTPGELRDVLKTAGGGEADRGTEAAAPASIAPPAIVAPPPPTPVAVAPPASPVIAVAQPPPPTPVAVAPPASPVIAVAQPPPPPVAPAPPPPPVIAAPPPPPLVSEPAPPSPPPAVAAAAAPPAEPFPSEPSSAAPAIAREDSQKKVKKKKPKKSRTNATICI
jgi:glutathione S-transferase